MLSRIKQNVNETKEDVLEAIIYQTREMVFHRDNQPPRGELTKFEVMDDQ